MDPIHAHSRSHLGYDREADMGRLAQRSRAELIAPAVAEGPRFARVCPKARRRHDRLKRQLRARCGWFNWYWDRGRIDRALPEFELRMLSNRRAL
jgi:hypothetical protein